MISPFYKTVITVTFLMITSIVISQTLQIASYNIRYDNPGDSLDLWKNRHTYVSALIKLYDIEIFGTQEGLRHQLEDMKADLEGFDYIGVGRDDGDKKGEYAAIFYNKSVFRLTDTGNFWLSQVTDRPNKGWDAALPRICTWGKFRVISSGKEFFLFNVHFDHLGEQARRESTRLIVSMIRNISGNHSAILTGDFNFNELHPNYDIIKNSGILVDTYDMAKFRYAPGGTFTGFDITAKPAGRIDHIFVTGDIIVNKYAILTNTYNGRYPSDHFAVMAEIGFTE